MGNVVLGAPDKSRVNITCLIHDTYRLCQLDVKKTVDQHGTNKI